MDPLAQCELPEKLQSFPHIHAMKECLKDDPTVSKVQAAEESRDSYPSLPIAP